MPDVFTSTEKSSIPEHSRSRFGSFYLYPDDISFETKDDNEKIVLLLRQHPIVNLKWIVITLLLLAGPAVLGVLGVFSLMPTGFPLVISLAWYLVTSAYAIEGFLNWYFNVFFVTTEGIIDVDFFNLVDKRVSEAELGKIQDVSYTTSGVFGTMLNFGNVQVQTASEIPEFVFESVPNPEKVAKILDDLIDKTK